MQVLTRCACGYNLNKTCSHNNASVCNVKTVFRNHVTFPPMKLMPPYEKDSTVESIYYSEDLYNTRHWATLVQIESKISSCSFFPSERWVTSNTHGEPLVVHIYKDYSESEKPTTFKCKDLMKNRTLAILYPENVSTSFVMINFLNYDTCYVFNANLSQVQREAQRLLNDADLKSQSKPHVCFHCGTNNQVTKQCSECKLAKYCSRVIIRV